MTAAATTSTAAPPRLGHRPGLDALRGIAVVSIVAYHADPDWFPLAPVSLDVFFVLSTFLVTTLLLETLHRHGEPGGSRFFTRRVRRLAPALVVMVAAVIALAALGAFVNPDVGRTALGAVALHANIAQFDGDYFSAFAQRNPLEHTWSLSVEEHFYLVTFAAVAASWWLTRRDHARTRIALGVVAAAVAVVSILTARHLFTSGASVNRVYMGTDTRAVAAAVGVLLAVTMWSRWDAPGRLGRLLVPGASVLSAVALGAMLLGWRPTLEWYATGGWALTAAAAALVVAAAARSTVAGPVSSNGALQWAGRRSYGIYLWHLPLIVLAAELGGWWLLVALIATGLAAEASHRLVEHRFRAGALVDRTFVLGATGALVVVALFAVSLEEPERPEWADATASDTRTDAPPELPTLAAEPTTPPGPAGAAAPGATGPTTTPPAPIDVVVWGDGMSDLVGAQLRADGRFSVAVHAHPDCRAPASCTEVAPPPPPAGTDAVVVAVSSVAPFHPLATESLDIAAPERHATELWGRITAASGGVPLVVAMEPDARRELDAGLHLRGLAGRDPANLVLGAEPSRWPEAVADRFGSSATQRPTKILLVGDSVAYSLATAFRPTASVVWDQSRHGCDPAPGDRVSEREGRVWQPPVCDWRTDWASAVSRWDPDVVVWHTGTWSSYDRHLGTGRVAAGSPEWTFAISGVHAEALRILGSGGARVVVAVQAPAWETAAGKPVETRPDQSAWRMPAVRDAVGIAVGTVRAEGVRAHLLDTSAAVCVPDCNRPDLRDDGVHYTPTGAAAVSAWIEDQLGRLPGG